MKITFESDGADEPPRGFEFGRTGEGRPGKWRVQLQEGAPSGKQVLVQTDADATAHRFPVAYTGPELKDLRLSVRCKMLSGKVDQGCGLVWRVKDAANYYVARANALEDNVRIYQVEAGKRTQLGSWSGRVAKSIWHDLVVDADGDHFVVHFNGKKVLDVRDATFALAGKWGVWTKADSIIAFDDLMAIPR